MNFQKYLFQLFLLLLLLFPFRAEAQGWERTFGSYDEGQDLVIATNGDAVILANDYQNTFGGNDFITGGKIARYNPFGEQIFQKDFMGNPNGFNRYYSMCQANDGGYLVSGITHMGVDSFGQTIQPTEGILVKISELGEEEWVYRMRPDSLSVHPQKIIPTSGGYLIAGSMTNDFTGKYSNMLMKTDNLGEPIWIKDIAPRGRTNDIVEMPDGSILATGGALYSRSSDFFFIKLDANGNELWEFNKDNPDFHYGLTIEPTLDSGFLVGAHTQLQTQFAYSLELMRFNSAGDTLWTKYVDQANSYGHILNIKENPDSTFWVAAQLGYRMKLYKLDKNGNEIIRNTLGTYTSGGNIQIRCAPNNGLYVGGTNRLRPFLARTDSLGFTLTNNIAGNYAIDNTNCDLDSFDFRLAGQLIEISKNGSINYARTDQNGKFNMRADTGFYTIKSDVPNNLWELCQDSQVVDFQGFFEKDTVNFLINETEFCPFLKVNISAPRMRRCFDNTIHINYCNEGSKPADDAYIEVMLDARLTATSATLPWTSVTANTYRFDVGDLGIFECGKFQITTQHNCDSVQLGETFCMEAHIFPDSLCIPIDSLWDGSNLASEAICEGDSVRFKIRNNGSTMQQDANFIIIEDDMVLRTGNLQSMPALGITELTVAAEGSTYRIEVNQAQGHPFQTKTSVALEACGLNPIGQFSTGFVTMFSTTDTEPFLDMECVEVRGAYDPNDKEAFPKGVCSRSFIFDDTPLEYKIRFQNTGTDTAFRVEIRDTLPPLLDPMTLEIGGSSHGFDWDLTGEGILIFSFENIMLPDSNINEAASHGFIQYKIKQRPGNVVDAEIHNSASIYFDFNAPIKTNTVRHTIGDDFLTRALGDLMISGKVTREDGTPIDSAAVFLSNNCIAFTDADGFYVFDNIEAGQNYDIQVMKDDLAQTGVTILDMIAINNHIINVELLPSSYSMIAADASNSGNISTVDMIAIRKVIFEIANEFLNNSIWQFFDKNVNFASAISLQNLTENSFDNDFIGVKTGDAIQETTLDSSSVKTTVKIDTITTCGDIAFVDVQITHPDALLGGQFSLSWDSTKLNLLTINGLNSSEFVAFPGKVHLNSVTLIGQIETIFQLEFLPILSDFESTEIFIEDNHISPQFVTKNNELTGLEKSVGLVTKTDAIDFNILFSNPSSANMPDGMIEIEQVLGGTGVFEIQWNTGDTSNFISNLLPGEYTVSITDSGGCIVEKTIILSSPSSGNTLILNETTLKITPNPTNSTEQPVLQIKSASHQKGEVIIHDISGKMLRAQKFEITQDDTQISLPQKQPSGMYLVTVRLEDGSTKTLKWTVN